MTISATQAKAARKLLSWTQAHLADKAGLSGSAVAHFENGARRPSALSVSVVRKTLEAGGVEFTKDERLGVKLREAAK
jgi:transcriptional regulator with XRE-family HTH domain